MTYRFPLAPLFLTLIAGMAASETLDPVQPAPGPFTVEGLSAEAAGEAIFRQADTLESGYGDLQVELEMVLRTSSGNESRRSLRISQLEMPDSGDRLLVVFDTPKSIRGTALLSYAYRTEPDDQWMYLPALKRVKRIASQNRSGPFLSSEFAYEDMALQEVEKFTYRLLDTLERDGSAYYQVERVPTDQHSGYGRQVVLLDAEAFRIHHIEYYDRHGRLLKTLEVDGYEQHLERFWKPRRMLMANVQTGKSTELEWRNYAFSNGLDADRDFSTNSLRRVR